MKKFLRIVGIIAAVLILAVAALLGILSAFEYRPADTETVIVSHEAEAVLETGSQISLLSWNCGYGALGDNADFFMDGGSSVYTADRERLSSNLKGIRDKISEVGADLVILQEVDINSSRSYGTDERTVLRSAVPAVSEAFAYNFNSLYVPYPIPPIGHVEGGLYVLSTAEIADAERVSLPCPFSWPVRIVNLKRCLLVCHIPLKGTDRLLTLINLHLEAYDNGEGKIAQTEKLVSLLREEAAAGNYVIAGGDFNQLFSSVDSTAYPAYEGKWQPGIIDTGAFGDEFLPLMDPSVPTCRSLDQPYAGASDDGFQFYMIDGFIVSRDIQVDSMETLDCGFVYADHNPVLLRFTLPADSGPEAGSPANGSASSSGD